MRRNGIRIVQPSFDQLEVTRPRLKNLGFPDVHSGPEIPSAWMQGSKLRCASQMRITDPAETPPHSSQKDLLKKHTCQLKEKGLDSADFAIDVCRGMSLFLLFSWTIFWWLQGSLKFDLTKICLLDCANCDRQIQIKRRSQTQLWSFHFGVRVTLAAIAKSI